MADDDFEEGSSDDMLHGSNKKGGKKGLLIVLLLILVLIGGVAAAYFMGVFDAFLKSDEAAPVEVSQTQDAPVSNGPAVAAPATSATPADVTGMPVFMTLPEIRVNLNTPGSSAGGPSRPVFIVIVVILELGSQTDIPRIEQNMPRIRDVFNVYLRELRPEELKGSAGLARLREELVSRINYAVQPLRIKDVLFDKVLVQ